MISAALSPSDQSIHAAGQATLARLRVQARLHLDVSLREGRTRLDTLGESGGYRIKFPDSERSLEAVTVNTGGGLLGGDALLFNVNVGAGAFLSVTTQSAEKVYRAVAEPATIDLDLTVASGGHLEWIPQECILFSGTALHRSMTVRMAIDSTCLIADSMTFGRLAMGERITSGSLRDRWRIYRDGDLVFADDLRLEGDMVQSLDHPARGGGARAIGTILLLAPDADKHLDTLRSKLIQSDVEIGISCWDGKLILRMLAAEPTLLRQSMAKALVMLRDCPVPRCW